MTASKKDEMSVDREWWRIGTMLISFPLTRYPFVWF